MYTQLEHMHREKKCYEYVWVYRSTTCANGLTGNMCTLRHSSKKEGWEPGQICRNKVRIGDLMNSAHERSDSLVELSQQGWQGGRERMNRCDKGYFKGKHESVRWRFWQRVGYQYNCNVSMKSRMKNKCFQLMLMRLRFLLATRWWFCAPTPWLAFRVTKQ